MQVSVSLAFYHLVYLIVFFLFNHQILTSKDILLICLLSKKNKTQSSLIEVEMVPWHSSNFEHNLHTLIPTISPSSCTVEPSLKQSFQNFFIAFFVLSLVQ